MNLYSSTYLIFGWLATWRIWFSFYSIASIHLFVLKTKVTSMVEWLTAFITCKLSRKQVNMAQIGSMNSCKQLIFTHQDYLYSSLILARGLPYPACRLSFRLKLREKTCLSSSWARLEGWGGIFCQLDQKCRKLHEITFFSLWDWGGGEVRPICSKFWFCLLNTVVFRTITKD